MTSRNQSSQRPQDEMGIWLLLLLLGASVALPALVLGILAQRLTARRSWSFLFWLVFFLVGLLLAWAVFSHGAGQLFLAQWESYVQTIERSQMHVSQWNIGQLWSRTWPVWVRTLVLTPAFGFWGELGTHMRGERGVSLEQREVRRQRQMDRAKKRAARRLRHPERLPDAIDEQMVIGSVIDDEQAE